MRLLSRTAGHSGRVQARSTDCGGPWSDRPGAPVTAPPRPGRRPRQSSTAGTPTLTASSLEESGGFVRAAGLRVDEVRPDRVRGHIDLDADHHTPWGIVHGGVYATAIESAASIGATRRRQRSGTRRRRSDQHHPLPPVAELRTGGRRGGGPQPGSYPTAVAGRCDRHVRTARRPRRAAPPEPRSHRPVTAGRRPSDARPPQVAPRPWSRASFHRAVTEWARRGVETCMESTADWDVIVVGAGLAGLCAAATARQAGSRVVVLEAHGPGGRARTVERDGFVLNMGAHALYRHGAGIEVLAQLGVVPTGVAPPLARYRALAGGRLHALPTGPGPLLRTGAVGAPVQGPAGPAPRHPPPPPDGHPRLPVGDRVAGPAEAPPRRRVGRVRRSSVSAPMRPTSISSAPTPPCPSCRSPPPAVSSTSTAVGHSSSMRCRCRSTSAPAWR